MAKPGPVAGSEGARKIAEAHRGSHDHDKEGGFAANPELAREAGRKGGETVKRERGTEFYAEIYDLQVIDRMDGQPKQRSLTLDLGGRHSLDRANHIRLLFMGGRAIQAVTRTNGEPSWIAYVGVQFLLGRKEKETPGKQP